ncbi:DUF2732 family protein [Pseudomonas graminis]
MTMHMKRQDIPQNAAPESLVQQLCAQARVEGRKDMATTLSARLNRLATDVAINELSAVEIIQLMRDESENWGNQWN